MNAIRKSIVTVCILVCLTGGICENANAQESLESTQFHSDDHNFTSRINDDSGAPFSPGVDTVRMLFSALEFEPQVSNIPLQRSFSLMHQGENVCVVNKIKTPQRDEQFLISLPLNFYHSQRLYQLKTLPPIPEKYLNHNSEVLSISQVLKHFSDSSLIVPRDYSYGENVDNDLATIESDNLISISNSVYYERFMQLFEQNRAEFALIFPLSLYQYFGEDLPIDVRRYAIANNPAFVSGRFICADTPVNQTTLKRINSAIVQLYQSSSFLKVHQRYVQEEEWPSLERHIQQKINKTY